MIFTNNIIVILLLIFFAVYFVAFEVKFTKKFSLHSKARSRFIAIASLLFYATWYPPAILLLIFHTFLGMYGGRKLAARPRKTILFTILILALLPLAFFKYFDYFITGLEGAHIKLILPLGLSFYTFSMVGYYVDIYENKIKAQQDFWNLLLFTAFWPHLAAGPILRAKNIFTNVFKEEKLTRLTITTSLLLIAVGLVKKLLIADNIGAYVNWNISYGIPDMSMIEAWATILGFSAQIYADFSGYSDMAIGFALLMGFKLPANFNYPYRATTITSFWHRWHISLSTWFRDYLYFPLGGNKSSTYRTYLNIMIVFVLSGIWHGVGIGFAIWGAIHGALLVLEKIMGKMYLRLFAPLRWFITTGLIVIAWSFFRLDYSDAIAMVAKMCGLNNSLFFKSDSPYYVAVIFMMLLYPVLDHMLRFYKVDSKGYPVVNRNRIGLLVLSILILLAFTFSGSPLPFIYFEF